MLKVSRLADYAVMMMCALAEHGEQCSASEIAALTKVAKTTVSKVLKVLGQAGLIRSTRGINGGYVLTKLASHISLAEVVAAVDGPIALTACSTAKQNCSKLACCDVKSNWQLINKVVDDVLSQYTLDDMMKPMQKPLISKIAVQHRTIIPIKIAETHEHRK